MRLANPIIVKTFPVIAAMLFLFPDAALSADFPLKKISCALLWKPQAQFAGYIVAAEKGFYKKHGLDVTLVSGAAGNSAIDALNNKKADFCIAWLSSAVQRRSQGSPLVNIGQVVQRSALMLVAKRSSGILTPADMQGRKVSLWEGDLQLQPLAFFRANNIVAKMIPQSYSVNLFLMGGVDVVSAMWYNEYHTMINSGLDPDELVTFFFSDHGLNFPEDGIYCLEETLLRDPGAASAFVKATFEGWEYAFGHTDEALDIVLTRMKQEHLPANRVHQQWMLSKMKELIIPRNKGYRMGVLDEEDFGRVNQELARAGYIGAMLEYRDFFRPLKDNVKE